MNIILKVIIQDCWNKNIILKVRIQIYSFALSYFSPQPYYFVKWSRKHVVQVRQGREKLGLSVKSVMAWVLERLYYCWLFREMLFSSKINCTPEREQILCSPPLLLITKVSEAAWSCMHLNIFFCHLLGGACPRGLECCLYPPASEFIGQQPTVEEHSLPWTRTED